MGLWQRMSTHVFVCAPADWKYQNESLAGGFRAVFDNTAGNAVKREGRQKRLEKKCIREYFHVF